MSLIAFRDTVIEGIRAGIPDLGSHCRAHGGRFDLGELKRVAVHSPSVLVACFGAADDITGAADETDFPLSMAAFVAAKDKPGQPRDDAALALVQALCLLIRGNDWGRSDVNSPARLRAQNLFSSAIDKQGIALWMVSWRQTIAIAPADSATLNDFLHLYIDYDINQDGAVDLADDITVRS